MGLGPSTKMTSLFHFNCPVVKELCARTDIEIPGVIISGVSESYQQKMFIAHRVGNLIESMRADGVIVITDGWGNHHIDFVSIIEESEKRGIPTVGMSFFGLQGRLVYTSEYLNTLIDLNKGLTGYESCIVGANYLSPLDAYKAVSILNSKIKRKQVKPPVKTANRVLSQLAKRYFEIDQVRFNNVTKIEGKTLSISNRLPDLSPFEEWVGKVTVSIIEPDEHEQVINSNLDFLPIAVKQSGTIGNGTTAVLDGVIVMVNGVEQTSGFQPANIGSSEGLLAKQVRFGTPGTPRITDNIIMIDVLFKDGQARTRKGIRAAHQIADLIIDPIRQELKNLRDPHTAQVYEEQTGGLRKKVVVVKIVSGLGNMYETTIFPKQPAGITGSCSMMEFANMPVVVSANQILDGVIHSLL